ncbi:hypothetical protein [Microbacterium foliorum]|uniref:hypothetical protein n=1 Tax=Microbacterium foliorum TaxID=104336 RepID=UPI001E13A38C|nr:hypothetical protein [Microbacterium foliorum]CAH0206933.1 hypothetical protein SRABI03_02126 [Microbacterium foliorum]CAH0215140.1 hypothetical protein SRABI44_02272 [Microbacterium foliorum]
MLLRETLVGPRWLTVAGASTLVFLAVITAISAPVVVRNVEEIGGWVIALLVATFILILGAGLIGLDKRIRVSVSATHIDAHLSLFRVMHIPVSDVEHVEIADVSPSQAGGLGWRVVGSDRFVLWSSGPAIWLTLTDGRSRVIRTDRPEELKRVIQSVAHTSPA